MSAPPDFLETEIQKLLDIVERQCDRFNAKAFPTPKESGEKKQEKRKSNGVRDDA